ncbi:CNNM domain-containing protein, partial [Georgenia sp. 10Sc9-8]|nr:CNNM domain-containing protein [Georgenia halotolerans]
MIDPVPEWWLAALAVLGIALGAVLTAGETALDRITRSAVAEMEGPRADRVRRLADRRAVALPVTSFVRVLAEMTAAVCLTLVVADLIDEWWLVLLVAVGATAALVALVIGASPRTVGRRHPARVLSALTPVMLPLAVIAGPVVRVAGRLGPGARRTEAEAREEAAEDLRDMVDRVSNSEELEDDEREMLQSVFELGRTLTREVMVPRTDMVTLDATAPLHKAITLFVRSGFSRVPVVGESTDDLRGVLYLKDALRRAHRRPDAEDAVVA